MSADIILRIIDALMARGWDAIKWKQNRDAVKAQLEAWHAANASDEEKLAAIDQVVADIDANSAILQAGLQPPNS